MYDPLEQVVSVAASLYTPRALTELVSAPALDQWSSGRRAKRHRRWWRRGLT
jgi:hypothetical protein